MASVPPRCERAARAGPEANERVHPADYLHLDGRARRRHLLYGDRLIQRRDDRFCPNGRGQRRCYLMPERHRMRQPVRIGDDVAAEAGCDLREWPPRARHRLVEPRSQFGGGASGVDWARSGARVSEIRGR